MNDYDENNVQDMIAYARHRDETEAFLLGDHTPMAQALDKATQRQALWDCLVSIAVEVAASHPNPEMRAFAQNVLQQVRSL